MRLELRKEQFSLAYIRAVCAAAGFELVRPEVDDDSIDGLIVGRQQMMRPRIEFQAKATARNVLKSDHLAFPLSRKNYDDLRLKTIIPRFLFIVVLPEAEVDWLTHSEDALCLRHCGYWVSIEGEPDSQNESSITVRIPRTQVLDREQISELMLRV